MTRRQDALDRLLELVVVISNDMEASLAERGLTGARAHIVWELQHHGPRTQRQLAEALDVTPRNITGLVDALADTGFVTREPHPSDRRATLVTFTAKGLHAGKDLEHEHEEFARLLFTDMPDGALDGLISGIDHVLTRLYAHGAARTAEVS